MWYGRIRAPLLKQPSNSLSNRISTAFSANDAYVSAAFYWGNCVTTRATPLAVLWTSNVHRVAGAELYGVLSLGSQQGRNSPETTAVLHQGLLLSDWRIQRLADSKICCDRFYFVLSLFNASCTFHCIHVKSPRSAELGATLLSAFKAARYAL